MYYKPKDPKQFWPNQCKNCKKTMEFDLSNSVARRVCMCGTNVRYSALRGEFVWTDPPDNNPNNLTELAEKSAENGTFNNNL